MTNALPSVLSANVPDYLRAAPTAGTDTLAAMFRSRAFARVSTADNQFTLITAEGEEMVPVLLAGGSYIRAPHLDLAFVKWSPTVSKQWYEAAYSADSVEAPDCFSLDGVRPDPTSPKPQSNACAGCPHNAFGSASNGKGKACQDSQRTVIMLAEDTQVYVGQAAQTLPAGSRVFGYKIAPMTGKNLAARVGEARKAGVNFLGTKLRATFVSQGVVDFQFIGYLSAPLFQQSMALAQSEETARAIGEDGTPPAAVLAAPPAHAVLAAPQPMASAPPVEHPLTIQVQPTAFVPQPAQPYMPPQPQFAPAPAAPVAKTRKPRTPKAPPEGAAPQMLQPAAFAPQPVQQPQFVTQPAPVQQTQGGEDLLTIPAFLQRSPQPSPVQQVSQVIQQPQAADADLQAALDRAGFVRS